MLREAFQPFEITIVEPAPPAPEVKARKFQPGEDGGALRFSLALDVSMTNLNLACRGKSLADEDQDGLKRGRHKNEDSKSSANLGVGIF